ncbi:hypothetical protein D3C83_105110 [compost metagenome]
MGARRSSVAICTLLSSSTYSFCVREAIKRDNMISRIAARISNPSTTMKES